uniref:Cytochrome P450 71A4 n=1 Tax=Solanum lycopersicum TaxID=4081 RepID=A0A3Q7GEG0_SOLLC
MHYLKAVIKESRRLHPPIPLLVPRESIEDIILLGYKIPAKTGVIINSCSVGRDLLSWEKNPEEYRPERFLDNNIDLKGLNFELIPFGAGRRGCPGIVFAIVVIELALARIVHKFNLALSEGLKPEELNMTGGSGITIRRISPPLALPPSPTKLPIIGNLHQLGSLPHRSLHKLSKKYGSLMLLHFGSKPVIVASSVDAARDIMKTRDLVWSNRPKSSIADRIFYGSKDLAFSPYGEYWRQIKSITVLHLLSNKRVQSYRVTREEETSNMIEKIRQACDSNSSSSVINLRDCLCSLTNNIVSRVALGRKYNEEGQGGINAKVILHELGELLGTFSIGDYIPWLEWINKINGLDNKVEKVAKELDTFLESVIEEHVSRKNRGENSTGEAKDFVDVLLEIQNGKETGFLLQRDSLKAIILDNFAAGTDTTYTALEWIMIELLRHPRVMKKLEEEVRELAGGKTEITEDDLRNMQYLKAVIKETLRLHPPIPLLIPRESTEDIELLGYHIPAKTQVIINAWAIGRDPLSWDDPEEYRPERFLNSNIDLKGLNFELIPFGAGRRGCPGISFALVVIELALARLVHKFNFSLPKPEELDMTEASGVAIPDKKQSNNVCSSTSSLSLHFVPSPLPPSPTKLPIIGNLHQLGSLPHRSLHKLSKKYGSVMLLYFGSKPVIVASSVDAARDIMKTHELVCSNRPKSSIAERLFYGSKDVAFSPYGEYWRQIKSVTVLHLLSNKRVQSYRDIREEETSNMIIVYVLSPINIVSRVALGRKYNEGQEGINAKITLHELGELLGTFSIGDYIPWLEWINKINGLDNKVEKVAKELDTFLESVIEEHVSRRNRGEYSTGEAKDFVDVLLEIQNGKETGFLLQRDSLKAIILDIFAAGTDTTYTALE